MATGSHARLLIPTPRSWRRDRGPPPMALARSTLGRILWAHKLFLACLVLCVLALTSLHVSQVPRGVRGGDPGAAGRAEGRLRGGHLVGGARQEGPEREALAFRSPAMAERLADALSLHLLPEFNPTLRSGGRACATGSIRRGWSQTRSSIVCRRHCVRSCRRVRRCRTSSRPLRFAPRSPPKRWSTSPPSRPIARPSSASGFSRPIPGWRRLAPTPWPTSIWPTGSRRSRRSRPGQKRSFATRSRGFARRSARPPCKASRRRRRRRRSPATRGGGGGGRPAGRSRPARDLQRPAAGDRSAAGSAGGGCERHLGRDHARRAAQSPPQVHLRRRPARRAPGRLARRARAGAPRQHHQQRRAAETPGAFGPGRAAHHSGRARRPPGARSASAR